MRRDRRFFEGWYFKHRTGTQVFAAIPGMACDREGRRSAFVQTISGEGAAFHEFPIEAFSCQRDPLRVTLGDCEFSAAGARIKLPGLRAELRYGPLTPLTRGGDIMGPLARWPFLECYHGVLSLWHRVDGFWEQDGRRHDFICGSGYLEKDWGRSFPNGWVWMECHEFGQPDTSLMLAVAEVPLLGGRFRGIICVCRVDGVQHRLASYLGARMARQRMDGERYRAELRQGRYRLTVDVCYEQGGELRAPRLGLMERTITEYPSCILRARLDHAGRTILDAEGTGCGFECVQ